MLKGENIFLRAVKESDLAELYASLDNMRMRNEYFSGNLLSEYQFRLSFHETGFWSEQKGMLLLIHQDLPVGVIWFERQGLFDCLDLHFYIFRPEDRGKSWMKEALLLFSSYLFSTKKTQRIQISIPNYSKGIIRLAQKCGFQFEGIVRSALFHRGEYLDLCLYSLLRSECKEVEKIYS